MVHKRYEIEISGKGDLSGFLTKLVSTGTKITSLFVSDGTAYFRTDRKGVAMIRRYRRKYRLKVSITITGDDRGVQSIFHSYRFFIACLIPLICSYFLWSVEVESDMPEVAERIETKLRAANIVPLRPLALLPDEGEIRRDLMLDDPSLSWVRFRKVGGSLTVIPMLSPPSTKVAKPEGPPSDLVARTGGIITRFELKKGERVSHVHQTVKRGDVLATGTLVQGDKVSVVGADGSVFADYWVEYNFTMPKTIGYKLQGEEIVEYQFNPPWKPQTKKEDQEKGKKWLPQTWIDTKRYVKEVEGNFELKKGMEESVIIPLLKSKFLSQPFSKAIVKDEKILHVTFDNDKVSGTILFLINDNIAIKRPISQGDEANWMND